MNLWRSTLVLLAFASVAHAQPKPCISVWTEARYGNVGYHHLVHLANGCDVDYACDVSTNVNPDKQRVRVPARHQIEVTTFLDSPSRVFVPKVDCKRL